MSSDEDEDDHRQQNFLKSSATARFIVKSTGINRPREPLTGTSTRTWKASAMMLMA